MAWEKVPPYTGTVHQGCFCCPAVEAKASMQMIIGVGFGHAAVTRDGVEVYNENNHPEEMEDYARLEMFASRSSCHTDSLRQSSSPSAPCSVQRS